MANRFYRFAENFIFYTHGLQWLLAIGLFPLSLVYCLSCVLKKLLSRQRSFGIPVISIGNLTVGGSGKTPVTIAIAKLAKKPAIVLRGYGRKSKGLVVVSDSTGVLCDVESSGDEAMEYAMAIPNSIVIVSEDRLEGIKVAKESGAKVVLLDDGFGKFGIAKYDILLEPAIYPSNPFCLPAGPYRCPFFMRNFADFILRENEHFVRRVTIENESQGMLLVTSISNPARLEPYLPKNIVHRMYFRDHEYFDEQVIREAFEHYSASSLLVTGKDAVKLADIGLELSTLKLEIVFDEVSRQMIESLDGIK